MLHFFPKYVSGRHGSYFIFPPPKFTLLSCFYLWPPSDSVFCSSSLSSRGNSSYKYNTNSSSYLCTSSTRPCAKCCSSVGWSPLSCCTDRSIGTTSDLIFWGMGKYPHATNKNKTQLREIELLPFESFLKPLFHKSSTTNIWKIPSFLNQWHTSKNEMIDNFLFLSTSDIVITSGLLLLPKFLPT